MKPSGFDPARFQEIYRRTREVNPKGYEQSAPIHFADGLVDRWIECTSAC